MDSGAAIDGGRSGYIQIGPLIEALEAMKTEGSKKKETPVDVKSSSPTTDIARSSHYEEEQPANPCSSVELDDEKLSDMRAEIDRLQAELQTERDENDRLRDQNEVLLKAEDKLAYLSKHEKARSGSIIYLAERCKTSQLKINNLLTNKGLIPDQIDFDNTQDGMICYIVKMYIDLFIKHRQMERESRRFELVAAGKKRLEKKLIQLEHSREPVTWENSTLAVTLQERIKELEENLEEFDELVAKDEKLTIHVHQLEGVQKHYEEVLDENKSLKETINKLEAKRSRLLDAGRHLCRLRNDAVRAHHQLLTQYNHLENHLADYKQWVERVLNTTAETPAVSNQFTHVSSRKRPYDTWVDLNEKVQTLESNLIQEKEHSASLTEEMKGIKESNKIELARIARINHRNKTMYHNMSKALEDRTGIIAILRKEVSDLQEDRNKSKTANEEYEKRICRLTKEIIRLEQQNHKQTSKDDRTFEFFETVNQELQARLEQLEHDWKDERAETQRSHNVALYAVKTQLHAVQQEDEILKASEAQKTRDLAECQSRVVEQNEIIHDQKAAYDDLLVKLWRYMEMVQRREELAGEQVAGSDGDDEDEDDEDDDDVSISLLDEVDSFDEEDEIMCREKRQVAAQHCAYGKCDNENAIFDTDDETQYNTMFPGHQASGMT